MTGWHHLAACKDQPLSLFFPVNQETRRVKELCNGCPVRAECLSAAIREEAGLLAGFSSFPKGFIHGVRGGLTPQERWLVHDL